MILESLVLVLVVYMLFYMVYYKILYNMESSSAYECGFEPHSYARVPFSYRFFLISILFIIFDVEISLMLPVPFLMESNLGMWIFMMFMLVLIIGLFYEYMCGSLDWLNMNYKL